MGSNHSEPSFNTPGIQQDAHLPNQSLERFNHHGDISLTIRGEAVKRRTRPLKIGGWVEIT